MIIRGSDSLVLYVLSSRRAQPQQSTTRARVSGVRYQEKKRLE